MAHRRKKLRVLISMAAVLLQIHLAFVLQLHHHGLDACRVFESASIADGQFHARAPEDPLLPCPACHVAEHILITYFGLGEIVCVMPVAGEVPLPARPEYALLRRSDVYGRGPPRS